MRSFVFSAVALLVVLAAGCNPVGMDETRCYVMGRIYTDSTRTAGAENVAVFTEGTQETYSTMTNQNGDFFIEIQMYPQIGEGEEGSNGGYSSGIPGYAVFSLKATVGQLKYTYGIDDEFDLTVFGGDTLTLYDIDLSMFK